MSGDPGGDSVPRRRTEESGTLEFKSYCGMELEDKH